MIFELSVIVISVAFLLILFKLDKDILKVYGLTFIGVLLFEYFTQSLWLNLNLEPWAYLYMDVSWVITIGWATIITVSRTLVDLYCKNHTVKQKFLFDLVLITIIGVVAESAVLSTGIRKYSSAVLMNLSGLSIGNVPIEALYYIPVFMALVLSFTIYWEYTLKVRS